MPFPPEVQFHRYFHERASREEREQYKGKHDLARLEPPTFEPLLLAIQEALNEMLRSHGQSVPEHVHHHPFHVDYVDSTVPNALAFHDDDYSFIGITIPLIYMLWDASHLLSRAEGMGELLGVNLADEERDALRTALFRTILAFVVCHEWTHHVHGHVAMRDSTPVFFEEILDRTYSGDLDVQALEIDADGYAAYHVLANLIDGSARPVSVRFLNLGAEPASVQDEVLFACLVVAVGAFFYVRPPVAFDRVTVYKLTHPPQAARMDRLMHNAIRWCRQNRPDLEPWMTLDRFQRLMRGVAEATLGDRGALNWSEQTAFLQSENGVEYMSELEEKVKAHIQSLKKSDN